MEGFAVIFFYAAVIFVFTIIPIGIMFILEAKMNKYLTSRERELSYLLVTNLSTFQNIDASKFGSIVLGEAVIASDKLKQIFAGFRRLFGGRIGSYVKLAESSRRLAVIRLLEQAKAMNFDAVCNIRIDSARITALSNQDKMIAVAYTATGTAYKRKSTS